MMMEQQVLSLQEMQAGSLFYDWEARRVHTVHHGTWSSCSLYNASVIFGYGINSSEIWIVCNNNYAFLTHSSESSCHSTQLGSMYLLILGPRLMESTFAVVRIKSHSQASQWHWKYILPVEGSHMAKHMDIYLLRREHIVENNNENSPYLVN